MKAKVAVVVKTESFPMPTTVETFTITIDDVKHDGAKLGIIWENTYVEVPFSVPTDEMVTASIQKVMGGPTSGDYYNAAVCISTADKDIERLRCGLIRPLKCKMSLPFGTIVRNL